MEIKYIKFEYNEYYKYEMGLNCFYILKQEILKFVRIYIFSNKL